MTMRDGPDPSVVNRPTTAVTRPAAAPSSTPAPEAARAASKNLSSPSPVNLTTSGWLTSARLPPTTTSE
ncbi:MAG: hypothetical protein PGN11_21515 [Quadrisphaera sp.]